MKKSAIIKIVSTQLTEDGSDVEEMSVAGTVSHEKDRSVIEYIESDTETGNESMSLTVTDGRAVNIVRRGAFSSEMSVEKDVKHHMFYKTPYGDFTVGVYGNDVKWMRNGDKSILKMSYTLDFNNGFISKNKMNIYISEK